jgi:hypothetical protein
MIALYGRIQALNKMGKIPYENREEKEICGFD